MNKKENTIYGPNIRDFMEGNQKKLKSYSKNGKSYIELPNNIKDPIISNNIAWSEFNYTYDDESDIMNDDYFDE
ncbi:hypothetical protein G8S49_04825 [Clostridium botulinum C]|uniref:Uncharacterized protein n=3 Tax=Clostridium botulinum TaxID=1491 RepID=A0A9Q4XUJ6_CLOBO|nr:MULTISPECIES: hypothetical protein [Clostridium]EGO87456.1 hypothetical protein CBCST_11817 [Clostridium botulinum C str. Stockholm]AYF53567.1 hypothetical protein DFH04_01785 [Clostridium novyi]EES91409.1 conserved hypothetical protein [Clostridium botulinum D str. 1873]KEI07686.1 hypothetical protein Z957_08160 [Clostridium sp. K25]MBO3442162.1 hypothetical protein [Clostridium haemolyticum]